MIIKSKTRFSFVFLLGIVFCSCSAKPKTTQQGLSQQTDTASLTSGPSFSKHQPASDLVDHHKPSKTFQQQSFTQWHQAPTQAVLPQTLQHSSTSSQLVQSHLIHKKLQIGVLLPLSGAHQAWGKLIQASLTYLQKQYPSFAFKFADTQSDPIYALKALDRWVKPTANQSAEIDILLGPLSPQVILHLSQRIQWYELPWFPLGSLPTLSTNHVNFSWRLEAQDEAQALADYLCMYRKQAQIILLDQPKSRLIAKRLQRLLKSCRVKLASVVILHKAQPNKRNHLWKAQLGQVGRVSKSHSNGYIPTHSSVVILARGKTLKTIISLLVKESSNLQRNHQSSYHLITSLGSGHIISRIMRQLSDQYALEGTVVLERPALAQKGQLYMKEKPTANSLELELADLLLWLKSAQKISEQTHSSLLQAIRRVSKVQGQWGLRKINSGKLLPATIQYYQVHGHQLKRNSLELLAP